MLITPSTPNVNVAKPVLKWPGGKRQLLPDLIRFVPSTYRAYFEPFFGGGALFFRLAPTTAVLNDLNADLINCYRQIRDRPLDVIAALRTLPNDEHTYYRVRSWEPSNDVEEAARLYYLALLSFNGIYRVNLDGAFNVPYGHKAHIDPSSPNPILAASSALQASELRHGDFAAAVASAGEGDLVYLDPPYTVAHNNNGFIKYNARIFSWNDQRRLATLATELKGRGCTVIVSNADHRSIQELYAGFQMAQVTRTSRIAANASGRRPVTECIFWSEAPR